MKVLLITFSDNADHQDIVFGMFESMYKTNIPGYETWVMGINSPKVKVVQSPYVHLVNCPKRPGLGKETFNLKELLSIIHWINKIHFDVIFFETLHIWNLPIMIKYHRKTKIFQMIHDLIPHEGDKQAAAVHLMNKAVCKLADYIVLCNQKYVSDVTKIYGVPSDRVCHVDMWRRFSSYIKPKYTKHCLFFGRMNPYKGVDNLLYIVKACPELQFDVIGRVDPQVQGQVDEMKKYPNVNINSGYVSDEEMTEAFVNSDWVLLPYNSATQSGVVIDGYRCGRPSIAFRVGAIAEQIQDGISGYLVEPGDNDAFVRKLKEVIKMDNEELDRISKSAYEFGLKKYSADGAVERFIELINK